MDGILSNKKCDDNQCDRFPTSNMVQNRSAYSKGEQQCVLDLCHSNIHADPADLRVTFSVSKMKFSWVTIPNAEVSNCGHFQQKVNAQTHFTAAVTLIVRSR